ncbi:MAG: SHOCT domain-containing protein, partial [Ignavibacteriaceae bacterium]
GFWFGWVFWVAVIGLIVYLIVNQGNKNRQYHLPPPTPPYQDSPLDILKRRYAKGEINKEQFEQMKKDIE